MWFGIVAVLFVVLLGRQGGQRDRLARYRADLLFLYPLRHDNGEFWSPYYEVSTTSGDDGRGGTAWTVSVNGVPHQRLTSVATREADEPYYLEPYKSSIKRKPGRVLIVGAGTGTDVAIALAQGATHVDAVEIDPTLQRFGAQHDPDHAYQDPRVSVHINDGRAFLQQTDQKYDLILFALPDSLTLVSGASSLRLESYLFTLQAAQTARDHLAPDGAFAMYNYYREQWIVDRLAGTLADAFGHAPCVYAVPNVTALAVLTAGRTVADQHCGSTTWQRPADTPAPSTDDRPFVYLRDPGIPGLYRSTLLMIILVSIAAIAFVLTLNALQRRPGRRASAARAGETDVELSRPVPARGRVPAARDEERHRLRVAVRDDLDRQRVRVRRRAHRRAGGGRTHRARAHPARAGDVRSAARWVGAGVGSCRRASCSAWTCGCA